MVTCVIPKCSSSSKNCNLSFFEIPVRREIRLKWIQIIDELKRANNQSSWILHDRDVVCSKHFLSHDFQENKNKKMLKPEVLPSVFSNYPDRLAAVYKKKSITVESEFSNIPVTIVCRLCGTNEEELVDIFDNETIEYNIPRLVHMYLPIEIPKNDERSRYICYQCISTVVSWNEFYQQTLTVDSEFDALCAKVCKKNVEISSPNIQNDEPEILIQSCTVDYLNNQSAENAAVVDEIIRENESIPITDSYLDALIIEEKENPVCHDENNTDQTISLLTKKPDEAEPLKSIPVNEKTINYSVVRLYQCNICNEITRTNEEFRKHMVSHRSTKNYNCNICGTTFNLKKVMESHIRNTHSFRKRAQKGEPVDKTCFHCCKTFVSKATLNFHIQTMHWDGKSFVCDVCESEHSVVKEFETHVNETNHRTDGQVSKQCPLCGLDFGSRLRYKKHLASKHEGGLKCSLCDVVLKNHLELQDHEALHPHLRPFKCEFCGKNFKRNCDYKKHQMVHTGERPHVCEVCGKSFNRKHNMKMHRRSHYGDKPFNCPHCSMSFFRFGDLRKHKQLHYLKSCADKS